MFQCTLQKSRLVFLVGLLTASAGAVSVFGQEEGKARVSQDSQSSDKQKKARSKKKPALFRWVNPMQSSGTKTLGLRHSTFKSPSMHTKVGVLHLPTCRLYKIGEFEEKVSSGLLFTWWTTRE